MKIVFFVQLQERQGQPSQTLLTTKTMLPCIQSAMSYWTTLASALMS
jgi:hypothetical protein